MKEIKIAESVRKDQELMEEIGRVNQLLEEEIGPSASEITAEWSFFDAAGEEMVKLEIFDNANCSATVFSRRGLSLISQERFRISLVRLWGDLLQERSHKQMKHLKMIVQGLESA